MEKKYYISPDLEELQELLCSRILDASGDAELEGYEKGYDFDW